MPIPKPNTNEMEKDFINRCMSDETMINEYKDNNQRSGVCYTQWKEKEKTKEEYKLETREIIGKEIFEVGTWKNRKYTEDDIDTIIENFDNRIAEPYINLNHDDKISDKFREMLKVMSLGFVKKLYKKGKKLIADFKQVPKTIAELIEAGALKQASIELFPKYLHANGRKYNNVLGAVTFHGGDGFPAISSLSDFVQLYKNQLQKIDFDNEKNEVLSLKTFEKNYKGETTMDKVEITKNEYNELVQLKADKSELNKEVDSLNKEIETYKNQVQEKENELVKLKASIEKEKANLISSEANSYVDEKIKEGKIQPNSKKLYVSQYIAYKNDKENFEIFKSDIEQRENNLFKNIVKGDNTMEDSRVDDIDEAIKLKMKQGKSFADARKEILNSISAEV